ncbi:MAG: TrkA family potassium uptake protein [Ruminococcaceae bacterium]|nr:TrkA family potassium uptake protein [Oscillospiraceae bacterium]
MSILKSYAVFGLGRYGKAVAEELVKNGAEVLAVDKNESLVNNAIEKIPFCRCADVTDAAVIKQLGISNIDVVIVSMAHNLEASVMATILCKEAGVETVIVKCADETQQKVLLRVGADKVVLPENESGIRLAKNLLSSGLVDIIELSKNVSMVEIPVRNEWEGKSLIELNLRQKYSINVVAIKQENEVLIDIDPSKSLDKTMTLIVIADTQKLAKLK